MLTHIHNLAQEAVYLPKQAPLWCRTNAYRIICFTLILPAISEEFGVISRLISASFGKIFLPLLRRL